MDALKMLESLQSYGYKEKVVTVGEVKIKLASLTAGEIVELFEYSSQFNDIDAAIGSLKLETIVRSVVAVNDIAFDPSVIAQQKRDIISKFGDELVNMLFDQYCEMDKSVMKSLEKIEDEKLKE